MRITVCEWRAAHENWRELGVAANGWDPPPWGAMAEACTAEGYVRMQSKRCYARTVEEARELARADLARKLSELGSTAAQFAGVS